MKKAIGVAAAAALAFSTGAWAGGRPGGQPGAGAQATQQPDASRGARLTTVQQRELDSLRDRITELERQNTQLEAQLRQLEAQRGRGASTTGTGGGGSAGTRR